MTLFTQISGILLLERRSLNTSICSQKLRFWQIYQYVNKALEQVYFSVYCSVNGNGSVGGSSSITDVTCHIFFNMGRIGLYFIFNVNDYSE